MSSITSRAIKQATQIAQKKGNEKWRWKPNPPKKSKLPRVTPEEGDTDALYFVAKPDRVPASVQLTLNLLHILYLVFKQIPNVPKAEVLRVYKQLLRRSRAFVYTDKQYFRQKIYESFKKWQNTSNNNLYYIRARWLLENDMGGLL